MHRPPLAVGRFLRGVDKKQGGEREGTCGGRSNEGQWFDISPCHRHGVAPPALTATTTITAILHPVRRRVLISTGYAPSPGFFRRKLSRTVVDSMKPPRYPSSLHPFFPRAREIWRMERVVRGTRTLYNATSIDHRGNRRHSTFWPSCYLPCYPRLRYFLYLWKPLSMIRSLFFFPRFLPRCWYFFSRFNFYPG